jgi:hypothetical protein
MNKARCRRRLRLACAVSAVTSPCSPIVNRRDRPYLLPVPREVIAPPAWHCAHAEAGKPFIVPNHWAISLRQTFDGSFHYPGAVRAGSLFVNRSGHSFLRRLNGLWTTNDGTPGCNKPARYFGFPRPRRLGRLFAFLFSACRAVALIVNRFAVHPACTQAKCNRIRKAPKPRA